MASKSLFIFLFMALISMTLSPLVALGCASCGCTLSPGFIDPTESKFRLDLRYDFINQNQLRSGTSTIAPNNASQRTTGGSPQEVESDTNNTYLSANLDYMINSNWKVGAMIPYILRDHSTLGTASDGTTAGNGGGQYNSSTKSIGDAKILGRYLGLTPQHNLVLLVGVKLPTGSHTLTGTSTDPTAPGQVAIDRGLQPGSGTTDLILGISDSEALNRDWDYFAEALYQAAENVSDNYRPGDGYNLNLGLRYFVNEQIIPQVQLNGRFVENDSGSVADQYSTGGTLLYFSPGLNVRPGGGVEIYAFLQLPLYQNLLGVQLVPNYTASLGVRYLF